MVSKPRAERLRSWLARYGFFLVLAAGIGYWYFRYMVVHEIAWSDQVVITPDGRHLPAEEALQFPCVVHFYASWCGPCVAELPKLSGFAASHRHIRIYLITDDSAEKAQRVSEAFGLNVLRADDLDDFGVHTIPVTYFYDKRHEQVMATQGAVAWDNHSATQPIENLFSQ